MATYNFTDWGDTGEYTYEGSTYTFDAWDYYNAIDQAFNTDAENYFGEWGILTPTDSNGDEGPFGYYASDLMPSFGADYGSGELDLINWVDFDLSDDDVGDWQSMIDILGDGSDYIIGGHAVALDATGTGFIQVTSNFNNGVNTFVTDVDGKDDKLFELWHIDGLEQGEYVTAQIISGTLTDANLHVWGEQDGYQPSAAGDQISWPYYEHDVLAIDTTNMDGVHTYGDYNYTLNIVTDWNDCSEDDYESFDWGYMQYSTMTVTEYSDMNWGYIEYTEFTTSSYEDINWAYAEFDEFDYDIYDDLDWGYVAYDEFTDTSYSDLDWGYVEYDEFDYDIYSDLDWGYVEYSEISYSSYSDLDWGYVEYSEISYTSYSYLDWGYIEYGEFSDSSYSDIDWGYAEFDEFETDIYGDLDWGYVGFDEFDDNWSDLDWGYVEFDEFVSNWTDVDWGEVQYNEFNSSTYKSVDWGEIQFNEFDSGDYKQAHWGKVEYNEFDGKEYKQVNWGKVQYNELGNDDYKKASWNKIQMKEFNNNDYKHLNWGKVEYKEVLKSSANLNDVDWGKVETNEWDKGDLKILTKKSTDKKLDKLKKAELDINILTKGKSFKGDSDDDVITTSGSLLKKKVKVKGGAGNDTFVLKKGKGSMEIKDFEDKKDEINFAYAGSASKIKLKQKGKDTLIYSGKDLLATVKDTKKKVLSKKANGLV